MTLKSSEIIEIGKKTILLESQSLENLVHLLDSTFADVVNQLYTTEGRVVITGIGKSAIIGQKMVATFNSTGTPSLFMHAADAIHGDLGMIQTDDVVICISKSGNSPEIKALVPLILHRGNKLVGIVGNLKSFLAEHSDFILDTSVSKEACPNNLAPTSSTTAQMAMGDALAVALMESRGFKTQDFAKHHPGGALGKQLYLTLGDIAQNNELPTLLPTDTLTQCILTITKGRLGAAVVLDGEDIQGIITDGDLRRMLSTVNSLQGITAKEIMTANPKTISSDTLAVEGVNFIKEHSINHLILINSGKLIGLVNIQDLIKEGLG